MKTMSSITQIRMRRILAGVAGLALGLGVLTGCSAPPRSVVGSELRVGMQAGPGTLDPATIDQASEWYVDLAYSPLIQSSSDGKLRAGLATKWGYVGSGNTKFSLTLRSGVKFSDGSKLTAAGVKQHLEYEKGAAGQYSSVLATLTQIDVTGPLSLELKFSQPNPNLTFYFSQIGVGIADVISPSALKNPKQLGTSTFGAGPYVLDQAATVPNDTYVYTPNPHYWDKANVHWKKVTIKVIPNLNSMLNALKSGQIDFSTGDYTTAPAARTAGMQVHFVPNVFSGLNLLDRSGKLAPALGDVRVRQAINYAIDRKAIVKAIYGSYGTATTQTTHGVGYVADLDNYYPYNPKKAKQLLAAAGYPNGFTLSVVSTPIFNGDTMVQAIAGQLAKVGITVKADSKANFGDYFGAMAGGTYQAAWIGFGTIPMFVQSQSLYGPGALFNPFKSTDAQLTSLSNQLAVASPSEVQPISERIEKRLVQLAWYAPVAWAPLGTYATKKIDPAAVTTTTGNSPIAAIIDVKPAG